MGWWENLSWIEGEHRSNQIWWYIRFVRVMVEGIINYIKVSSTSILGTRWKVDALTRYGYSRITVRSFTRRTRFASLWGAVGIAVA